MWAFLKIGYGLELEKIQKFYPELVDYLPELSPALKMELHEVKMKCFSSGHVEFYSNSAEDLLKCAEAVNREWVRFKKVS